MIIVFLTRVVSIGSVESYQVLIKYFVYPILSLLSSGDIKCLATHATNFSASILVIFGISQRVRLIYVTASIITREARTRKDVSEIGRPIISTMTTLRPNLFSKSNEYACFTMPNIVTTAHSVLFLDFFFL